MTAKLLLHAEAASRLGEHTNSRRPYSVGAVVARLCSRMERVSRSSSPDTDAANHGCLSYRMGCHSRRPTGFQAVESTTLAQVVKQPGTDGYTTHYHHVPGHYGKSVQILTNNVTAMTYIANKEDLQRS